VDVCDSQDPQAVYRELPREHELLSVVAEIAEIAGGREDAVLLLARKIFTRLFEVQNARCVSCPLKPLLQPVLDVSERRCCFLCSTFVHGADSGIWSMNQAFRRNHLDAYC
jgi:hypothetical protein